MSNSTRGLSALTCCVAVAFWFHFTTTTTCADGTQQVFLTQIQAQVMPEAVPDRFVTVLPTFLEVPRYQDEYSVLALRRYYDQVVGVSLAWSPKGLYVREVYEMFLNAIHEGTYEPSPQEVADFELAYKTLFEAPRTVNRLKGVKDWRLKPEIVEHLNQRITVITKLTDSTAVFDQGLVFTGFAELLAGEGRIHEALSLFRGLQARQLRVRKDDLEIAVDASSRLPVFSPYIPDWFAPQGWREIELVGNNGLGRCIVDVRRVCIVRPWFSDSVMREHWFRIREDSDANILYQERISSDETFFETMLTAIPVELVLGANMRLVGEWTPETVADLPLVVREMKADPMIIALIAERSPKGPYADTNRYTFGESR